MMLLIGLIENVLLFGIAHVLVIIISDTTPYKGFSNSLRLSFSNFDVGSWHGVHKF